ncbi:NADH dehydrogenase [ubiquinone] 1 beta subcomplex subunit 11, mitochondrial [Alligator mississippiensis]|uniref:NADH dehydrogenase [ubiquinone] 1 beta subcomplex subunit 11, mitochondrial n=2 Tax=Alligator mississippiensis TaxID=8496 RepID=A0A151NWQ6_ALLMI|nr:NADH dehydrogenase [ubiquinone] 1 beta subcomplex subunit 11, mitochondrial [Alligator mississippiensis]
MTAMLRKNPDYHGFHDDPVVDLWNMRIVFFFSVSVCIVIGFTLMHYMPDNGMQEWARREAERLVRQREAQGLPVLDPNYYDPKTLVFPPQDED